jgi:hypothetical protein
MQTKSNPPWHAGVGVAGQTLEWLPSDTKESFERMIQDPDHRNYFQQQGWLEPGAISYKINSQGFRCEEFETNTPCMIALGCSFTAGIGLPVDVLWPTLLGQTLGLKVYNLGWGGYSADTCFRLAEYWIPKLKPQVVSLLTPPPARVELITATHNPPVEIFLPASESMHFSASDIFLKNWFAQDENARLNSVKNKLAIAEVCRQAGAKFVWADAEVEMSRSREEVGYARDYMHAGPIAHKIVADKMAKEL